MLYIRKVLMKKQFTILIILLLFSVVSFGQLQINWQQRQIIWDTRNVKSGVYLYTLKSLGTQKSGKLIITK